MIISHSKRFIFLHGRKTAGSSIGISLMRHLSSGDIARGYISGGTTCKIFPPDWKRSILWIRPWDLIEPMPRVQAYRRFLGKKHGISSTHMTAAEIKAYLGDTKWNKYFKFTFERNPFERIVSFYFWRIKDLVDKPSFKQFVEAMYNEDKIFLRNNNLLGFSNLHFYMEENRICVDFIGRYEQMNNDLSHLFKKIGVEFDGWLPRNKSGIRPTSASFSSMATDEIISMLRILFKKEISTFGYNLPL
jgi:hypothetical protein